MIPLRFLLTYLPLQLCCEIAACVWKVFFFAFARRTAKIIANLEGLTMSDWSFIMNSTHGHDGISEARMTPRMIKFTANLIGFAVLFLLSAKSFAQWTEPQRLLTFSASGIQDVWITNDGLRLYGQASFSNLYLSTRSHVDSAWGEFVLLPPEINDPGDQLSPSESPSGDTLYFCDFPPGSPTGFDVVYSVRTDSGWGPKVNLGPTVNTEFNELSARISRDGTMLVVSSGGDLYYHERLGDGTWGVAIDFGDSINDWGNDMHVCLSPDNNRLFFYREGPNHGDVWMSERNNGVWGQAFYLPAPVCSTFTREDSPCLLADGATLVFRHGLTGGRRELYYSVDTTRLTAVAERPPYLKGGSGLQIQWLSAQRLTVTLKGFPGEYSVTVFNVLGQTILNERLIFEGVASGSIGGTLYLQPLPAGIYFLSVQVKDKLYREKFVSFH